MCINKIESSGFHEEIFYCLNNSLDNHIYKCNLDKHTYKCDEVKQVKDLSKIDKCGKRRVWYTKRQIRPLIHIIDKISASNITWARNQCSWDYHKNAVYYSTSNYILLYYLSIFERLVRISSYDMRKHIFRDKLREIDMSRVYVDIILCLDCFRKTRDPDFVRSGYESLYSGINPRNCLRIGNSVIKGYWRLYEAVLHKFEQIDSNCLPSLYNGWEVYGNESDMVDDKNSAGDTMKNSSKLINKGKCYRTAHIHLD